MRSLNRVTLIGNLAADPEMRETASGKKVANFALATNRQWKSDDGKTISATDYHKVVAWKRLGEICGEYLKKGAGIYLEGSIKNRSYESKEGEKKYLTEIIARNVKFLNLKKDKDGNPKASIDPVDPENEEETEE
ncbi:single-stranded DNA-binding protein [Patescibacteria group bacterium]